MAVAARWMLMALGIWIACIPQPASAAGTFTRGEVLGGLASVYESGTDQLAAAGGRLAAAVQKLKDHPGPETLAAAQKEWVALHLTHKRMEMLFHGPYKDRTFWTAVFFKQAYASAIENVVRSSRPIDAEFIELLGSSAKGHYAMEYLLFDLPQGMARKVGVPGKAAPRESARLLLEGPTAERRRKFVFALAADMDRRLKEALVEARSPEVRRRFVDSGQDSINLVVNQLVDGVESGLAMALRTQLDGIEAQTLRYDQVQGAASGTSLSGLVAHLRGLHALYAGDQGLGIDDYIRQVNPEIASAVEEQFKKAMAALEAIQKPMDQALFSDREKVEVAIEECRSLELLCKVDLVSALGVTIMFSANDGD